MDGITQDYTGLHNNETKHMDFLDAFVTIVSLKIHS